MKEIKTLLIVGVIALLLAACSPPAAEPADSDTPGAPSNQAPALAPVEDAPALAPEENEAAEEPVDEAAGTTNEEEAGEEMMQPNAPVGAGNAAEGGDPAPEEMIVAPSGEVDLGSLTPEPPNDEAPREMPAPGIPGPTSPLLEEVKQDLSLRFDIPLAEIQVIEMEEVTWPNSGLGCPQPGYAYMDVLVDGQRIVLAAGAKVYEYHSGAGTFVFCKDGIGQPRISPAPGAPVNPVNPSDT